ncbi:MAG TPA: hypothetical protein VLZ83_16450 [Edaphocola sp.]|nr:hypothetical protein [Edaphocola sp.]
MIKKLLFGAVITVASIFITGNTKAQSMESTVKYNKNEVSGFIYNIQGDKKIVAETVDGYFKNSFSTKPTSSKGFKLYEGVSWPEVSSEKLDVYYKIDGKKNNNQVVLLVSKGYDNFVSSQTDPMTASNVLIFMNGIKDRMQIVINNHEVENAGKSLSNAEKELERARKRENDLKKAKENLEKDILNQEKTVFDKEKAVNMAKEELEKAKAK